jgi:16S rRNA (cytidine1402-2'-O)-methyltransferase
VDELVPAVLRRVAAGERLKDAAAAVAGESGVARRELYNAALHDRDRP